MNRRIVIASEARQSTSTTGLPAWIAAACGLAMTGFFANEEMIS
jgi:hypothetical protein